MSVSESLEQLRSELGDLPERVAALLSDQHQPAAPEASGFPDVGALANSLSMPTSSASAAPVADASGQGWFPSSGWGGAAGGASGGAAGGASGGAGFPAPDFPQPAMTGFQAPDFGGSPASGGFPAGEFPQPTMTGFQAPDWARADSPLPFPQPSALAPGGGSGGFADGGMQALLERIAAAVEGGGGGGLRSSYPGLGLDSPAPGGFPWAGSWTAPQEGFPAASPSVNASSTAGLRGAGGFGYGSRLNTPTSDFLEPSRRFPRRG